MKKYIKYFVYLLRHKKEVFKTCNGEGFSKFGGLLHDMDKFKPNMFITYAQFFYGERTDKVERKFKELSNKHILTNKHHWNYWLDKGGDMPISCIIEMLSDWKAMGKEFGNTPQEFYMKNYHKIMVSRNTRLDIEFYLGLLGEAAIHGLTWEELCERRGTTMEEDLKELGFINK